MMSPLRLVVFVAALLAPILAAQAAKNAAAKRVLYAVNAGGPEHTSSTGVRFEADLDEDTKASPAGVSANVPISIGRVHPQDVPLYQTERYALESFSYNIPAPSADGKYTLVVKFAEVYFRQPDMKVFDIKINDVHDAVTGIDIFKEVGHGMAHDVYIPFKVEKGEMVLDVDGSQTSSPLGSSFRVEFVKTDSDNPKVCAIALLKGDIEAAKKAFPIEDIVPTTDEVVDDEEVEDNAAADTPQDAEERRDEPPQPSPPSPEAEKKKKLRSSKKKPSPYASNYQLPLLEIFIVVAVVVIGREVYKMLSAKPSADKKST